MSKFVQRGLQRLPLAIAVVAALQVMPVFAQDQSPATDTSSPSTSTTTEAQQAKKTEEKQKVKELGTVTVSGTLLKRPEYQTTSPVQVIDIKNNIAAGQFDTADFLMTSTAAAGTTQINGQFGGYLVNGGTGVQSVDLRGLGPNRTLVLLDGQRPGPAGTRGAVAAFDLNVIPQVILSRIEIIKDGSSSLYGSDAISGVVNLITKKRIDRPQLTFAASVPEHGGGEQYTASFATGWNFSAGSIVLAAQADKLEALPVGKRDFLNCTRDRVFGKDGKRIDRADQSILQGTSLAGCNNLYADTIINYNNSRIRYVPSKDGSTTGPFPGFHPRPYPGKTYANSTQPYYEDVLNYPFYGSSDAISARQRETVYAASNFTFGDVNWDTQFLVNRRESKTHSYRQFFPVVLNPTDGNYYEPIMPFPDNGKETVDYIYGTTKLSGLFSFTDSWSWEVNAGYSRSSGDYSHLDIDARKSGDLSLAANTLATPPLNYFDPSLLNGSNMSALVNALGLPTKGNTVYKQQTASAVVTGNAFTLPAGDVGVALGAEFRHYSINDQPPEASKGGYVWGYSSAQVTKGQDHTTEVYSEVDVPLLKALPGVESLALSLSGRALKYQSIPGTANVWKIGLNWQITPTVRARGTLGTSFRAPGLYELYLGDQTGFVGQVNIDPCVLYADSTNPRIIANCAAAGIPNNYAGAGSSATIHTRGGAGSLTAETSRAKSVGLVWTPTFANINLALDYFDYDIKGEIARLSAGQIVSGCYGSAVYPNDFCKQLTRRPANDPSNPFQITDINSLYLNINRERTRGYDLQMNYSDDYSFGKVSADLNVTYTMTDVSHIFSSAAASGLSASDSVGDIGRPKTVANSDISLKRGDWTYAWRGTFVGTTHAMGQNATFTYLRYAGATQDVKAGWQFLNDVSVGYERGHWGGILGVRNVFDSTPNLISPSAATVAAGNTPLYASQYDWYGRTFFARVNYKF